MADSVETGGRRHREFGRSAPINSPGPSADNSGMRHRATLVALLSLCLALPASAQTGNVRRMGMGGVVLEGRGPGSDAANVAYRAVPPGALSSSSVAIPLGLIPVLADPPSFDPDDPDFNIYELVNLLYNPPINLTLAGPETPSNDIVLSIAQDQLAVDLGDVKEIFPEGETRVGAVYNSPSLQFGMKGAFVGISPYVQYQNSVELNGALHDALGEGKPFEPGTRYELFSVGHALAAAQAIVGYAGPVTRYARDEAGRGSALYVGVRGRVLRGLSYGDADNQVGFTTDDTLFVTNPVDIRYSGYLRDAGVSDAGYGYGLDAGLVWVHDRLELGLGVNDIGTRIDWRVRESIATVDSSTGEFRRTTIREGVAFTSRVPVTVVANAALHTGRWLLAGDVTGTVNKVVLVHAGAETWSGPLALRGGLSLDALQQMQVSAGAGVRFGRLGFDMALATNSRNVSHERALELGVGLAFYAPEVK